VSMRKLAAVWIFMLLLMTSGCSGVPFRETPLVPVVGADPAAAVKRFDADSPVEFQLLNTIVFEYGWKKFGGLGLVAVNTKDRTFNIACINQLGVKLFELTGNKDQVVANFVMPEFAKQGDFAKTVGEDIKRIYFDLVPSPDAKIEIEKYRIVFRQSFGPGVIEYVFAGPGLDLVEKNYSEDGSSVWRISYYEYTRDKGKLYPAGTVLSNDKHGYRFIVRLKEIQE
jgi:hypothetical protein